MDDMDMYQHTCMLADDVMDWYLWINVHNDMDMYRHTCTCT